MGESRFERYVRSTLREKTQAHRDALKAKFDAEEAKIDAKVKALEEIAAEGLKALNAKIDAQAKKFGWHVREEADPVLDFSRGFSSSARSRYEEAATEYDYGVDSRYVTGPVREAEDAVKAFDAEVEKAAVRLVVCKIDLHMKPQEFDAALDAAVEKLVK